MDTQSAAELVTQAAAGPPDKGLAAVAKLRKLVDEWEAAQVRKAREAGWSWAEIARVLDRHRQAVHREYAGSMPRSGSGS